MGAVRWCEAIKDGAVIGWLTRRAREAYGKTIEPAAAERLKDLIGPDLQRLDNELAKLSLYEPEHPAITTAGGGCAGRLSARAGNLGHDQRPGGDAMRPRR